MRQNMVDHTLRRDFFPYPLRHGETMIEWSTEYLAPTREEAKFLAFLSLYGSNGVFLRDLITFATLRASRKPSENHWLLNGEAGPILLPFGDLSLPIHCLFLNAFLSSASDHQSLEDLQNRLLSLGLIEVENPGSYSFPTNYTWLNDERIWRVSRNPMSSHLMVPTWQGQDGEGIVMDLLYVFLEMPSQDVYLDAERHRETFYLHARLFALETLRFSETILQSARDYVVALILEILTHRSQYGDDRLIQFARQVPSSTNGFDWAIMVLRAELKAINASGELKVATALNNRIVSHLSRKGKRQCRTNGLIGYLLVEWMKAAESLQDYELNSQIVKHAMDWVETAWYSGSSIESAAVCCVLANFQLMDRSVLVRSKFHLLYGHYLFRAGHLDQAQRFLALGLSHCHHFPLRTRPWRYQFELISVLIRLGRRQQAEKLLKDIPVSSMRDRKQLYAWEWQQTTPPIVIERLEVREEHAEARILSGLYHAELLIAAGELNVVTSELEKSLRTVRPMGIIGRSKESQEDSYFQSLRLALEMRLLEVRICEGSLDEVFNVAIALTVDICTKPNLELDMVRWIIQQLLALSNRMVWAGNLSAASSLLKIISETLRIHHWADSLKDILSYAEQRQATLIHLPASNNVEQDGTGLEYQREAATNEMRVALADAPERARHNSARAAANSTSSGDLLNPMSEDSSGTKPKTGPWSPTHETSNTDRRVVTFKVDDMESLTTTLRGSYASSTVNLALSKSSSLDYPIDWSSYLEGFTPTSSEVGSSVGRRLD